MGIMEEKRNEMGRDLADENFGGCVERAAARGISREYKIEWPIAEKR